MQRIIRHCEERSDVAIQRKRRGRGINLFYAADAASRLLRRLRLLAMTGSEEGIAYVEFALMLPMLIALLMCTVEVTRYILINQKTQKVAMTVANVVAQAQTISEADLGNILTAASQIMLPYTFGGNGYVIVTSVTQTAAPPAAPVVSWQYSGGGVMSPAPISQIGTKGGNATLPNNLPLNDGDNIIIAEVYYNYTPLLPIAGTINGQQINIMTNKVIYQVGLYKPRLGSLSALSMLFILEKGAML